MKHLASLLLAFVALAASLPAQQQPVRVVATGGRIASNFYTPPAANTAFRHRTPHQLGGPVAEIQIGFMDWMYPYQSETPNNTNDVTIDHAWLERASTGQVVPLTFSGSRTLVLPMNSTTSHWLSDPVPSSAWTGGAPQRDEVIWLHVRGAIPAGGKIPGDATPASYPGAKFISYPPANDTGVIDTAGPVPAIAGSASRNSGLPIIFLGRFTGPGHLAVIGIGDSILHGTGDYTGGAIISGSGFFNRAAIDANGANTIATFNLTRHGQSAYSFITPARQSRQTPMLQYANVVVEEYGTNDLGQNGTGSASAIIDRVETIWSMARAAGVQQIIRTKLMPRTGSTDDWTTSAGQTPNNGWDLGEKRDIINAHFDTALATGTIDHVLDTLAIVAEPADPARWITNGSSDYITGDGTHVARPGNILLGDALRSLLLSLTVDNATQPPTGTAGVITIDNGDSAPLFTHSANWASGSGVSGYVGNNYYHDGDTRDGTRTALFTPDFPAAGSYAVELNWTPHANRATNVPVEIIHAGGIHPVPVNQKTGGAWHPLGTFTFTPGSGHGLYIDNDDTDGHVIVDAVRFIPVVTAEPGTSFAMQSWTSAPWNATNLATSFSAGFAPDGTAVTVTFANPRNGILVTNQAEPDASASAASFFGFEGTGFGVGNNGLGRFDAGESFTLTATHAFELQKINWYEGDADETLHLRWTHNGVEQTAVLAMTGSSFDFTNVRADANTPITLTNVSQGASLNGRLRVHKVTLALLD